MLFVKIDEDIGKYIISFRYDSNIVSKIKKINGAVWVKKDKVWLLPYNEYSRKMLEKLFDQRDLIFQKYSYNTRLENSDYIQQARELLILKGYSTKTAKSYLNNIIRFDNHYQKNFSDITESDVKEYILRLMECEFSHSYINQCISSLKFLYYNIVKSEINIMTLPRPKKEKKLPKVMSKEEVRRVLDSLDNIKHKTILYLIYSAGLRVSEAATIKIADVDPERMMIKVSQGKGRKDRYVMLSQTVLDQLRTYYKLYKPQKWLFQGATAETHITERTIQRIFKNACLKGNIKKDVSVHSLRHSFATHLLESGIDLRYIQELLGHSNSKTTEIYTHVSKKQLSNIKSPIDSILDGDDL